MPCRFSYLQIFSLFFGMLALEKYTRKDVMKVNTVKNIDGIPIPAITIDMYDESLMFLSQPFVSSAMLWLLPWNNIIKIQNKWKRKVFLSSLHEIVLGRKFTLYGIFFDIFTREKEDRWHFWMALFTVYRKPEKGSKRSKMWTNNLHLYQSLEQYADTHVGLPGLL